MAIKEINIGDEIGGFKVLRKNTFILTSRFFDVICQYGNEHTKAASDLDGSDCKKRECIGKFRDDTFKKISQTVLSKKYGIWQPLEQVANIGEYFLAGSSDIAFRCVCDCGEERVLRSRQLRSVNLRPLCKKKK